MRKFFLLLFLIFSSISLAQEIHIPFKTGKKFTISNDKGEFITDLKFDSIYFNDNLPKNYFYTLNDSKKALFGKGRLIINDLKGERLYFYKDELIIERIKNKFGSALNKEDEEILYTKNGERVFENQYKRIQIATHESIGIKSDFASDEIILFVQNFEEKTSIFIYDTNVNKIVRTLLKDYYSFKRETDSNGNYFIKTKKNRENSNTENFQFVIKDNSIEMISFIEEKKQIDESYEQVELIESEEVYDVQEISEASYVNKQRNKNQIKSLSTYIIKEKNKFYLIESADNKSDTIQIKLPKKIKNASIVEASFTIVNDTLRLNNKTALSYSYKNKKGIYFNSLFELKPIYDSIIPIVNHKNENFFILSKEENKKIKYGILNVLSNTIIPFEYDSLYITDESFTESFFKRYTFSEIVAVKNNKYGVISLKNKNVVPFKYDFLSRSKYYFYNTILNNKHGFIKTSEYSKPIFIEPIFTSKVKKYYNNYQDIKGFLLFELVDEKGNFKCYANEKGIEYRND